MLERSPEQALGGIARRLTRTQPERVGLIILQTLLLVVVLWRYLIADLGRRCGQGLRREGAGMHDHPRKRVPAGAVQHVTAGPYSPVIEINTRRLVVLSGQVAVDLSGRVVGSTIEEQTRSVLDNCRRQLATAGVDFSDVFKVNVYLSDLAEWSRFNAIYEEILPRPLPVRTAVQRSSCPTFRGRDRDVGRQA